MPGKGISSWNRSNTPTSGDEPIHWVNYSLLLKEGETHASNLPLGPYVCRLGLGCYGMQLRLVVGILTCLNSNHDSIPNEYLAK